jgi:outer membrane receptor protein involved in Fe transport
LNGRNVRWTLQWWCKRLGLGRASRDARRSLGPWLVGASLALSASQGSAQNAPAAAAAEGPNNENEEVLSGLSIENLLKLHVTIASKRSQSVLESPGFVTVYSKDDIRRLGYYTLADLARITPGYGAYTIFGETVFETRGQKAGSFNNDKHILFVDGIPFAHARAYKVSTEEELPLQFADQVEFLRGPAGALYGVSAFFGVINVTPKTLPEPGSQVETRVMAGPRYESLNVLSTALKKTEGAESLVSLGYFQKSPSLAFVGTVDDPNNLYRDGRRTFFTMVSHKLTRGPLAGLGAGFIASYKRGGLGEGFLNGEFTSPLNDIAWVTAVPYIKYTRPLDPHLSVDTFLKFNESVETGYYAPFTAQGFSSYPGSGQVFAGYESRTRNVEALAEVRFQPVEEALLIVGVDADGRSESGSGTLVFAGTVPPFQRTFFDTTPITVLSEFAQYQQRFAVLRGLLVTLGARIDWGLHGHLTEYVDGAPRVAITQRFNENWGIKAQYGAALRAPGVKELSLNNEVAARNIPGLVVPALDPEKFRTLELGIVFNNDMLYGNLVGFRNTTIDALDGVNRQGQNFFENRSGHTVAYGFDVDLRFRGIKRFDVFATYSYALTSNPDGTDVADVPAHKINVGGSYSLLDPIELTSALVFRWVTAYRTGLTYGPSYPGNAVVDLNFLFPMSRWFDLELQVRNLFNTSYKLPKNGIAEVPLPKADVLVGFAGKF